MKFIFADCLDYIDPGYNFITDSNSHGRKPYWDDMYPHEFMDSPPYDGILISRAIVGDHLFNGKYNEPQVQRFRLLGARKFLRYEERDFPGSMVLGDCGAFQYHKMELPPYSPEDMLEFYEDGRFTHGCSVDHIIFDFKNEYDVGLKVPQELKRRRDITLENARTFLNAAKPMLKYFKPIGVVQAWSPMSMAEAAKELVQMGYDYIALGGLVPVRVHDIHKALQAVREHVKNDIKIHLLGFAKANYLHEFTKYNIASFDTTSPLIRAFKDEKRNYWTLKNGKVDFYTAIKIPQVHANNKLKNLIRIGVFKQEYVIKMEQNALNAVRAYAVGKVDLNETIDAISDYTRIALWQNDKDEDHVNRKVAKLKLLYLPTLADRPWDHCSCRVCREAGIETVIFRSSNRNKRRGFHNLHIFNNYLKETMSRVQ